MKAFNIRSTAINVNKPLLRVLLIKSPVMNVNKSLMEGLHLKSAAVGGKNF